MEKLKKVPIKSYHKATLIALYDNEGEVKWDRNKFHRHVSNSADLLFELEDIGYQKLQQGFSAAQVALLFKYVGHPILNDANRKLLGIELKKCKLLTNFEQNKHLINENMEEIQNLTEDVLSGLGLTKKNGGDLNPHWVFMNNDKYYFIRSEQGFFEMRNRDTLKKAEDIKSTAELIEVLLKLKNKG